MIVLSVLLGLGAPAMSQPIPGLAELPPAVAAADPDLAGRRAALAAERARLHGEVDALNGRCAKVEAASAAEKACDSDKARLTSALAAHVQASDAFNLAAQSAVGAGASPAQADPARGPAPLDPASLRVLRGLEALARRKGWNAEKLARLDANLRDLDLDGPPSSDEAVRQAWREILAQAQDPDLAREAARGGGLLVATAGRQSHDDCAVFALANAAGLPYGVVAAQANLLIGQGGGRTKADRAHTRAAIEAAGLNGGEVIMLAETFGRSQIVRSRDFAGALAQGEAILANVAVPGAHGDLYGHEVAITKAFDHGGQTWFVVIDSTQGPLQRRLLSAGQLNTLLIENGVAYHRNPGVTPQLLRKDGAP